MARSLAPPRPGNEMHFGMNAKLAISSIRFSGERVRPMNLAMSRLAERCELSIPDAPNRLNIFACPVAAELHESAFSNGSMTHAGNVNAGHQAKEFNEPRRMVLTSPHIKGDLYARK
jgi:hypothetical protein